MAAIRPARLPDDTPTLLRFIMALQHFESAFEANRRLDQACAGEYFAELVSRRGVIFVAEDDDQSLVGWAVVHEDQSPVFVSADEHLFAYISELYVEDTVRGQGIGRALIAACEDWARAKGYTTIRIAHLAGNGRAGDIYDQAGYAPYSVMRRKRL